MSDVEAATTSPNDTQNDNQSHTGSTNSADSSDIEEVNIIENKTKR